MQEAPKNLLLVLVALFPCSGAIASEGITAKQLEPQQPEDHKIGKRRRLWNLGQAILDA